MSREKNLPRLNDWNVRSKDPHYIHYYFLINDIKDTLEKYARGNFLDLGCGNKPYETIYNSLTQTQTGCDAIQSDKNRVEVICLATDLKFENNVFGSQDKVNLQFGCPVKIIHVLAGGKSYNQSKLYHQIISDPDINPTFILPEKKPQLGNMMIKFFNSHETVL